MNAPEPPIESLRKLMPQSGEPRSTRRPDEFEPRYVDLPGRPRAVGARNLRLGMAALVVATILLGVAALLTDARAFGPLMTCLATFTILWVSVRTRLIHQRNGVFLTLTLVALLGATVPLLEKGWHALKNAAQNTAAKASSEQPATPNPEAHPHDELPLLTQSFDVKTPDPSEPTVKVMKDSRVLVRDTPYLIKAGELFPWQENKGGDVIFKANGLRLALPADAVEVGGLPANQNAKASAAAAPPPPPTMPETPQQATERSQKEAVRKYPALAVKDSPENRMFVETYRDLKDNNSELLLDPGWPLLLADSLAKREGWEPQ